MMSCIFCAIANKEIPAEMLYETDQVFVIKDRYPKAKVHLLAIPKMHFETLHQAMPDHAEIITALALAVTIVAKQQGIAESGYKLVSNNGPDSGQEVPHLHWHILGGQPLRGLV